MTGFNVPAWHGWLHIPGSSSHLCLESCPISWPLGVPICNFYKLLKLLPSKAFLFHLHKNLFVPLCFLTWSLSPSSLLCPWEIRSAVTQEFWALWWCKRSRSESSPRCAPRPQWAWHERNKQNQQNHMWITLSEVCYYEKDWDDEDVIEREGYMYFYLLLFPLRQALIM